jgi:hypothetical protein
LEEPPVPLRAAEFALRDNRPQAAPQIKTKGGKVSSRNFNQVMCKARAIIIVAFIKE